MSPTVPKEPSVKRKKIFIDAAGDVHAVYDDIIGRAPLGIKQVTRASNVEFNDKTQKWEATLPTGEVIASDESRDETLRLEVAYVEAALEKSLKTKKVTA